MIKGIKKYCLFLIFIVSICSDFKVLANEYAQSPKQLLSNFFNTFSFNFQTAMDGKTIKYLSNNCSLLISKPEIPIVRYCHFKNNNGESLIFSFTGKTYRINLIHHHDTMMFNTKTLAISDQIFNSDFELDLYGGMAKIIYKKNKMNSNFIFIFNGTTLKLSEKNDLEKYSLSYDIHSNFIATSNSSVISNYTHLLYKNDALNPLFFKTLNGVKTETSQNKFNFELMQADKFGFIMFLAEVKLE